MPDKSLCTGGGFAFWVLGALFVGFVRFSLEVYAFHGVDSSSFLILSVFHCLSQRRVGCSYALRVSPAVTRLTVYRRPQVEFRLQPRCI